MPKAHPSVFASAKRRALRAISQMAPDNFVPDRIVFVNDEYGFRVRISNMTDNHHYEQIVTWTEIETARGDIVEQATSMAVEKLARLQGESI